MRYAINTYDMAIDLILSQFLLAPVLTDKNVQCEEGLDGSATLVKPDVDIEQLSAIVEIIRKKYPPHRFRIYESRTGKGGWKRVNLIDGG